MQIHNIDCEETKGRNPQNPKFSESSKTNTLCKKQNNPHRGSGRISKNPKICIIFGDPKYF